MHEDFVSYDVPDPTDGSLFGIFYILLRNKFAAAATRKSSDRQKVGILRSLTNLFETTTFRTLVGTCLARIRMKAHHYVVESSSEPYNVFADFFGPRREGFRFEDYVTCLQSLAKSASAFCTRQILFLP
jgi:hypothetical protein